MGQSLKSAGDYQLFFHHPEGLTIPSAANKLGPGLGLQLNEYICTGGTYRWLPEHGPNTALSEVPTWLMDVIRDLRRPGSLVDTYPATPKNSGTYWLNYYLDRVKGKNRSEIGFALANQLQQAGLLKSEAMNVMLEYTGNVPAEGYNEQQALASLETVYQGLAIDKRKLAGIISINEQPSVPTARVKAGEGLVFSEQPIAQLRSTKLDDFTSVDREIGSPSINAVSGQANGELDLSDLDRGNIHPTGVGLRQGEIDALDEIGRALGKTLLSGPVARNALIRIAARRLIAEYHSGNVDLLHYFQKPEKPRPTLKFSGEE